MNADIAVLIPCYNEERTVADVVAAFRKELPQARIYVYDNNSTDDTVREAVRAGAIVGREHRQGKGHVVKTMFREIEADYYIMVDGDSTYHAADVRALLEPVVAGVADMTVGSRLDTFKGESFRRFHKFGNELIKWLINTLFSANLRDILSGYRCFSRRFVKGVPVLSSGFEIETELTLQALDKGFAIREVPTLYSERPEGSFSKLNTYKDGFRVCKTIFFIFKDYKPLKCFSAVALLAALAGLAFGAVPVSDYLTTGQVPHVGTAVLASGMMLIALLALATGFILDTISYLHKELVCLLVPREAPRHVERRDGPDLVLLRGQGESRYGDLGRVAAERDTV
jgi:glycosyltransferase involved in cell wall biosynthesis